MDNKFEKYQVKIKAAEKKVKIGAPFLIGGALLLFLVPNLIILGIVLAFFGLIYSAIGGTEFKKLSIAFKKEVLVDMIQEYVENGVFIPESGLSESQVMSTEFLQRPDRFHSEDYLAGKISGVDFVSSDVRLEERHVEHTKNGTRTYYTTYFLGRIFIFDFNKKFDGYLQVLESGRPTVRRAHQKVKLESVQFNKKFKTYATNEHSAFYVLTPHLMESLMVFEQKNKGTINFSFKENLLYIGIDNRVDTFELKMFRPLDERVIDEFKRELLVIKDVIDELKLNRNIFNK